LQDLLHSCLADVIGFCCNLQPCMLHVASCIAVVNGVFIILSRHKWSLKALVKSRYESDAKLQACDKDVRNTLRSSLRNRIHQQKVARESVASAEIGLLNKVAASPFSTRSSGGECCKLPQQGLGGPDRQSGFYRAMLCIARTIYMLSQDIYPSVRLSVTRRYSIETAKHTIKLFSPSVIHTILVFTIPNMAITRRSPP